MYSGNSVLQIDVIPPIRVSLDTGPFADAFTGYITEKLQIFFTLYGQKNIFGRTVRRSLSKWVCILNPNNKLLVTCDLENLEFCPTKKDTHCKILGKLSLASGFEIE